MTFPPDDEPDPTPTVPGFDLRRLLGRGAHAEVWLATDLATGASVALKIAAGEEGVAGAPAGGADEEGLAALAREVALLRRIDHPHIVRLLRVVGVTGGGLAAVLEHAPGGSLADLVAAR